MMTEQEKMERGQLYDASAPELLQKLFATRDKLFELNYRLLPSQTEERERLLRDILGTTPERFNIVSPFLCDYGHNIHVGKNFFANYNCVMLDGAYIRIGDNAKIGPACQIYTPHHPIDHIERRECQESAFPVTIGEDTWLGGGCIICPGVTIGRRCIIGAGSVVVHDIPDDSLAAGNPAVVKRRLV